MNGVDNHRNCTSRANPGFEFFGIEGIHDGARERDSLFAGVLGLSVDPNSERQALVEYLH